MSIQEITVAELQQLFEEDKQAVPMQEPLPKKELQRVRKCVVWTNLAIGLQKAEQTLTF